MNDKERIAIARRWGLSNVGAMLAASRKADVPFYVACALFEKESHGRNVYGGYDGGSAALSGYPHSVTRSNFWVFWWLVDHKGQQSNGVGPAQLTYKGFFEDMLEKGMAPWDPYDNMLYGLRLLKSYYDTQGSWVKAGADYNGATSYGYALGKLIETWKERLND